MAKKSKQKWKLKPKVDEYLSPEALIQRELIEAEKEQLENWAKQNVHFSSTKHTQIWNKIRDKYKQHFVDVVIKYLALINGAQEANSVLKYGMKMDDAGIDLSELTILISKAMRIDVAKLIASEINLTAKQRENFVSRVVARELPIKDGASIRNFNMPSKSDQRISNEQAEAKRQQPNSSLFEYE